MKHGELTAHTAGVLSSRLSAGGRQVLFDHGTTGEDPADQLGRITAWFGDSYTAEARLAFLDIAVVQTGSGKALALIEIEETTDKPKVLLGDALAMLLGDRVSFRGGQNLAVGPWTRLIVIGRRHSQPHRARLAFLEKQLNELKKALPTKNASVGSIRVDSFSDATELESKLMHYIESYCESSGAGRGDSADAGPQH